MYTLVPGYVLHIAIFHSTNLSRCGKNFALPLPEVEVTRNSLIPDWEQGLHRHLSGELKLHLAHSHLMGLREREKEEDQLLLLQSAAARATLPALKRGQEELSKDVFRLPRSLPSFFESGSTLHVNFVFPLLVMNPMDLTQKFSIKNICQVA